MSTFLVAHDVGLHSARGPVFAGVSLAAEPGDLVAVTGPAGSGRTALLLSLVGRCQPDTGSLVILDRRVRRGLAGLRDRRFILRHTGLAHVETITALDDALTVGEHVGERAAVISRVGTRIGRVDDEFVEQVWGGRDPAWGPAPAAGTLVWELSQGSRAVLEVQLAMMAAPDVLAVDNVHHVADPVEGSALMAALDSAREQGTCVIAAARHEQDLAGRRPDHLVHPRPPGHRSATEDPESLERNASHDPTALHDTHLEGH